MGSLVAFLFFSLSPIALAFTAAAFVIISQKINVTTPMRARSPGRNFFPPRLTHAHPCRPGRLGGVQGTNALCDGARHLP